MHGVDDQRPRLGLRDGFDQRDGTRGIIRKQRPDMAGDASVADKRNRLVIRREARAGATAKLLQQRFAFKAVCAAIAPYQIVSLSS